MEALFSLPKRPPPRSNPLPIHKQRIKLKTNLFPLNLPRLPILFEYTIECIEGSSKLEVLPENLIKYLRKQTKKQIDIRYHHATSIFGTQRHEKPIDRTFMDGTKKYPLMIYYQGEINQTELQSYGKDRINDKARLAYSRVFKDMLLGLGMEEISRNKFNHKSDETITLSGKRTPLQITIYPCYEIKLLSLTSRCALLVNFGSKIFSTKSALDIYQLKKKDNPTYLCGKTVMTTYNNRCYEVLEIDFKNTPKNEFKDENNCSISYLEYYQKRYHLSHIQPNQPLLKVSIGKRTVLDNKGKKIKEEIFGYLLPQFCKVTGIPDELADQYERHTGKNKIGPEKRKEYEKKMLDRITKEKLVTDNKCLQIEGNLLHDVKYQTTYVKSTGQSNRLIIDKLRNPTNLSYKRWAIVYEYYNEKDDGAIDYFLDKLEEIAHKFGGIVQQPQRIRVKKQSNLQATVRGAKNFDLVVVIMENRNSKSNYGLFKRILINQHQVPSQMITKNLIDDERKVNQCILKIYLQIHAKLGGTIWKINTSLEVLSQRNVAYAGLSVSKQKGTKTYTIALVGTVSRDQTKRFSKVKYQVTRQEFLSMKFYSEIFNEWLETYFDRTKVFPNLIILYREGLPDAVANIRCQIESKALDEAFQIMRDKNKIDAKIVSIVEIMVTEKTSFKLYQEGKEGRVQNPRFGTVVYEPLSIDNAYDFHMVAQSSQSGVTSNVTRYQVAYKNREIPPEVITRFTYEQCYNYPNLAGSICIPACLKQSQKLAKLVGEHIKEDIVSSKLLENPYFL